MGLLRTRQPRLGSWLAVAACAALFLSASRGDSVPGARADSLRQEAVYAAFLVNLVRFVNWPESALPSSDSPLVIGTFPREAINDDLESTIRKEVIHGHRVQTMRIRTSDDLLKCQVVFLSEAARAQTGAALAKIRGKPILSVSDSEGFLELGGHVQFMIRSGQTRLRVHTGNLARSQLTARSQLLRIAELADR